MQFSIATTAIIIGVTHINYGLSLLANNYFHSITKYKWVTLAIINVNDNAVKQTIFDFIVIVPKLMIVVVENA